MLGSIPKIDCCSNVQMEEHAYVGAQQHYSVLVGVFLSLL
jgi:hypothetical protein